MGHIKREHLKQAICAIPSQELIKRSAEVITPLIERSILSQQESKVLSELRDTLLPKLISGELRIPDAEKFLEEAGI
jgi:type I restriction enzyme S subunit